ncbi:tetratricopeptide repeat protein [Microlunatus flavus]|uniref:Predicted ATPase n=1 Tax=Microlunatus flavus TaxID=1036181 RepID=A0A1H9M1E7_9ACTN|nr:tetratricopeptide repeat protein [Microlunatus flavus]SER17481.1 Predicted ATPase [Microlunatus flavus]
MPEGVGGQPSGQGPSRVIRTPDHRLRVFVSSTLRELVPERRAVRAAVESLHLSPVMFELGARPHPPRELYRAYLDQSHVFVGIYWESYGWVAPEEEVSGLEDEYRLCGPKPKLIYVKTPAKGRQERLETLLDRIRADDTASYKSFDTPDELRRLVTDDLALMLTERFEASLVPGPAAGPVPAPDPPPEPVHGGGGGEDGRSEDPDGQHRPTWPRVYTALVGRDRELAELSALLARPDRQLVTLLGPGGIGKTRLALAVGEQAAREGRATYVGLATLAEPAGVLPAVGEALGLPETAEPGEGAVVRALVDALRDRTELVVLDNVEHVVDGVAGLGDVLEACPGLSVLATSRTPLRLEAEQEYPVAALAAPRRGAGVDEVAGSDAVRLFVDRACTVRPRFALTPDNADEVAELVRRLDGLPLALELAAARTRLMSPADLLRRLDRRFELLAGGPRDTPSRQQTLRSTIAWSVDQLGPDERRVLDALAVFERGCSLEAAEAVCGVVEPDRPDAGAVDVVEVMSVLVEDNLVVAYDLLGESRFTLLDSIRAYAREVLEAGGQDDAVHQRHAAHYRALAERAKDQLTGAEQRTWLNRLEAEHDNLRAALRWFDDHGDGDALVATASALLYFWWIRGHAREGRQWLCRAAEVVDDTHPLRSVALGGVGTLTWLQGDYPAAREAYEASLTAARTTGDEAQIASALGNLGVIALELGELGRAGELLEESLATNRRIGNRVQTSRTLINLSLVRIAGDDFAGARTLLEESVALNRRLGDTWGLATALINLGDVHRAEGELDEAQARFAESMRLAQGIDDRECVAYALEGAGTVAAARQDLAGAARLWGGADVLRETLGTPRPPSTAADDIAADIARVREQLGPEAFEAAREEGRATPLAQLVAAVMGAPGGPARDPASSAPVRPAHVR